MKVTKMGILKTCDEDGESATEQRRGLVLVPKRPKGLEGEKQRTEQSTFRQFVLGLDPAQIRDWAALSAFEITVDENGDGIYKLVNLERRQRMSYPDLVSWVIRALKLPAFNSESTGTMLVLDQSGIGRAVYDIFCQRGVYPIGITVTAGNSVSHDDGLHVGKALIYGKFLAAFDYGRVQINPDLPIYEELKHELLAFRAEFSKRGNAIFEAEEGEHDDLVTALALPVYYMEDHLALIQAYSIPNSEFVMGSPGYQGPFDELKGDLLEIAGVNSPKKYRNYDEFCK